MTQALVILDPNPNPTPRARSRRQSKADALTVAMVRWNSERGDWPGVNSVTVQEKGQRHLVALWETDDVDLTHATLPDAVYSVRDGVAMTMDEVPEDGPSLVCLEGGAA